MSVQTIGNDGLTDTERTVLAQEYERKAGTMTPEQVRAAMERIKARRETP